MKSRAESFLVDCPYCHTLAGRSVLRDPLVVSCINCGLYRPKERMNRSAQRAYLADLDQNLKLESYPSPLAGMTDFQWEIEELRQACPNIFQRAKVLDIGSAEGRFVAALQAAGAQAVGLEPLGRLVQVARRASLDVRHGYFESGDLGELSDQRFDLVTVREAIYYFPDLQQFFTLVRKLLRPQGWLYIKAHQALSYWYWRYPDRLRRFGKYAQGMPTLAALRLILQREKFDVQQFGYFPMRLLRQFGLTSRVFLPFDLAVSTLALPVFRWLAAYDRFVVIACKSKE